MNMYFVIIIIIFYFLWDILTLNNEVSHRIMNYKVNSKNIKRKKPLCNNKRKTVFLFVVIALLIVIITSISKIIATMVFIVMWFINRIIRRKRLKEIKLLDKENEDYWKG